MTRYEYLEVDLHGDSGVRKEPPDTDTPLGEGNAGYIARLNEYGAKGYRVMWIDRDTNVHLIAILEREVDDTQVKGNG